MVIARTGQRFALLLVWSIVGVLLTACGSSAEDTDAIDVLFVGNSYTYYNDMPEMVADIADANDVSVSVTMIASGGFFLQDHVDGGGVSDALTSGEYEVVVLQEQSIAPAVPSELSQGTLPAAIQLDQVADAAGVRVILFQTWGRRNGLPDFGFATSDEMQRALGQGYDEIALATGAEVARVGESWQRLRRSGAGLELHDADGSHPSALGSYAAALEITETILGVPMVNVPDIDGVTAAEATAIGALG